MQSTRLFSDKTIQKYILKYGKEQYKKEIQERLQKGEEKYMQQKNNLLYILERIETL